MERKRKIYSKNNQKMLPVLDYSFEMPILILSLNLNLNLRVENQFLIVFEKCQI
jgi:hypothetical protein